MTPSDPRLELFAGVDGGGTRCRVRLRDAMGHTVGEGEAGSGNIRLGLDLVWGHVLEALDQALAQAGRDREAFAHMSLGLGMAGISDAGDAERTIAAGPMFARAVAASDAHAACLGAHGGRDGGIIISGTGSAAYAWVAGRGTQVGGWGFELFDKGSAADLGRCALRAALEAQDGMGPQSNLTRAILARFGSAAEIVHFVTDAHPRDYGALAPEIMAFADAGDAVATALVRAQTGEIGRYVGRLKAIGADKVSLVGGMAPVFTPWLDATTRDAVTPPQHDALEGALLMAHGASTGLGIEKVGA